MALSTLTSKGQITLPKSIRDRLGLRAGDKLDFHAEDDGSIRVVPVSRTVAEVFGVLAEKAKRPYSTAGMKRKLARSFRERHR